MIPRAKKNLHACKYHLKNLFASKHFEEVEINFAAFVSSARSVTWVLEKEFNSDPNFLKWYGNPKTPEKGTKAYEMKNDALCKFFVTMRNNITKEGINGFNSWSLVQSLNTGTDMVNKPKDSSISIGAKGVYYHIYKGTPQEDLIPAETKGMIKTNIYIRDIPKIHLGKIILKPSIGTVTNLYYNYLEALVDEWTGLYQKRRDEA